MLSKLSPPGDEDKWVCSEMLWWRLTCITQLELTWELNTVNLIRRLFRCTLWTSYAAKRSIRATTAGREVTEHNSALGQINRIIIKKLYLGFLSKTCKSGTLLLE